ncbi:hypothetical protein [Streptomyces sp. NPDC059788]|uniref:hypothetical protein n=1 Tax=Streptomyces sp. NPDC059788 TaxID=3346948 RepID=UPI00365EF536
MAGLATVAATVLLGPGADGAGKPRPDGGRPSFTLRTHEPRVLAETSRLPRLTPAFSNTGTATASRGVALRVDLENAAFLSSGSSAVHDNCYYGLSGETVTCEFPDAVPAGAAYETAGPLPEVTGSYGRVEGAYKYAVWPLDDPPPGDEDYKAHSVRGTGPALGLVPVAADTLKGGGELRFAPPAHSRRADWSVKGITLRGRVGEYVSVEVAGIGHGDGKVRVELPPGTSFAPLSRAEREGTPSEVDTCARDDLDGHLYCDGRHPFVTLRVRIDRRVQGAEGRVSVREPIEGDTDPTNNSAPVKLEITGTAPPEETDPPVAERAAGLPG